MASLRALPIASGEVRMKQLSSQCPGSREREMFVFHSLLCPSVLPAPAHGKVLLTGRVYSPPREPALRMSSQTHPRMYLSLLVR